MSDQLRRARTNLAQIRTQLKRNQLISAATAIRDAVLTVLKSSLMKAEREEFERLIDDAIYHLNQNKALRQVYPLQVNYKPGEEKPLYEQMTELVKELEKEQSDGVQLMQSESASVEELLAEAQGKLDGFLFDEAREAFDKVVAKDPDNVNLKADIGERFLKAERYEEAFEYLKDALAADPSKLHLYNRIGIALRKMGKFDVAERYYMQALKVGGRDPNLIFNLGRLYIDWKKWDKVAVAAKKALEVEPDFEEARKMLAFAKKKLGV